MARAIAEDHRPDDRTAAVSHGEIADALAMVQASGAWAGTSSPSSSSFSPRPAAERSAGARWDEIDKGAALWTIPAERAKNARPHRIPLSAAALEVLTAARELPDSSDVTSAPRDSRSMVR